jgi:hypothetical protein
METNNLPWVWVWPNSLMARRCLVSISHSQPVLVKETWCEDGESQFLYTLREV